LIREGETRLSAFPAFYNITLYREHSRFFATVYGIGVGRVDKGAGFCAVSTSNYRINGGFAPLNPPYKAPLSMTCFFIDNIHGHPEPFAYVMQSGVEASFTAQDKLRRRAAFSCKLKMFSYPA